MCKAPSRPAPTDPEKPQYLRNPFLDAAIGQSSTVSQLRLGRSSLRIPLATTGTGVNPAVTGPGVGIAPPPQVTNPGIPPLPTGEDGDINASTNAANNAGSGNINSGIISFRDPNMFSRLLR